MESSLSSALDFRGLPAVAPVAFPDLLAVKGVVDAGVAALAGVVVVGLIGGCLALLGAMVAEAAGELLTGRERAAGTAVGRGAMQT